MFSAQLCQEKWRRTFITIHFHVLTATEYPPLLQSALCPRAKQLQDDAGTCKPIPGLNISAPFRSCKGLDTESVLPILEDPSTLGHPQLLPLRYFKAAPCHSSLKMWWVLGVVALGEHGEQELCSPNRNATVTL